MTELTEEQLKNMNPEELAEVQKQQCIFCQIVSGSVTSKKMYEDEKCIAILDINPANPGHILIIPKEHCSIMQLMPADDVKHLFRIAKNISMAQIRGLKVEGTSLFVANGSSAGQKAPHFMIHVIPRKENDGVTAFSMPKNQVTEEDQEKLRQAIKQKVNERLGITDDTPVDVKPKPEKVAGTLPKEEPVGDAEAEQATAEQEEAKEQEDSAQETGDGGEEEGDSDEQEEEQPAEAGQDEGEEEHDLMHIPPPEPIEQEEEEEKPKKKFDLDSISNMFK